MEQFYAHEFLPSLSLADHQHIFPESYTFLMTSFISPPPKKKNDKKFSLKILAHINTWYLKDIKKPNLALENFWGPSVFFLCVCMEVWGVGVCVWGCGCVGRVKPGPKWPSNFLAYFSLWVWVFVSGARAFRSSFQY